MSFISQNVSSKNRPDKRNAEESGSNVEKENGSLTVRDGEEKENVYETDMGSLKNAKRRKTEERSLREKNEAKRLEEFLFGSLYAPLEFGNEEKEEITDTKEEAGAFLIMDKSREAYDLVPKDILEAQPIKGERKPAWTDESEANTEIDLAKVSRLRKLRREAHEIVISGADYVSRLRSQHTKLNPGTEWAQLGRMKLSHGEDSDDEDDEGFEVAQGYSEEDNDILRTSEDLVVKDGTKLLPGILEFSRLSNANAEDPSNAPIHSVEFHRNAQLLLTAGLDRRVRFFQIDGKRNPKIQSIFIEDCPIRKAGFLPDGSQAIISGRRKFFYSLDIVNAKLDKIGPLIGREERSLENFEISPDSSTIAFLGREGYILLVSSKTKQLIGTLKMNGTSHALAFADDGRQLLSTGGDGHIYHWDLRMRRCFHKGVDEGCVNGTAISASPNSKLFAAGSDSGIVNVYDREDFLGGKRKPLKAITNLTTRADVLKFNCDSRVLAICSKMKKNGLKLVHVPSLSVFSNWPAPNSTLHFPSCLDFSPGGGFMAVGNSGGKVFLYKLHHYQHA